VIRAYRKGAAAARCFAIAWSVIALVSRVAWADSSSMRLLAAFLLLLAECFHAPRCFAHRRGLLPQFV
jgi:hypothetical protein